MPAKAYDNEADLYDAILKIVPGMRQHIEDRNGVWWVPNPVNSLENFADKWEEIPRKAEIFFEWLDALEAEYQHLLTDEGFRKVGTYLAESYGKHVGRDAMTKYASRLGLAKDGNGLGALMQVGSGTTSHFDVPHRERPKWPTRLTHDVTIEGKATREGWRTLLSKLGFKKIAKRYSLRFEAKTDVPEPFEVHWQVVNTGPQAEARGQLRGTIFDGQLVQYEKTDFNGFHWVECFIVKDGILVARSGEFVVNIE